MRRITISHAIRAKARARGDLVADLEQLERREPTSPEILASMARALGLSKANVVRALKSRRDRARGRRAP